MSGRSGLLALAVCVAVALVGQERADAYPHFQFSSGTAACAQCHLVPSGGGLLTAWGREESADTISRGGDGGVLHGAVELPGWLALGADVRVAGLAHDTGSTQGTTLAVFPMQVDVGARLAAGAWSATGSVGLRGAVRSGKRTQPDGELREVQDPSLASTVISREHFVAWRPASRGAYVRAGRFAAPFGLRLLDHTAYVRRYLGYNLLEETYGLGGAWIARDWEAHATVFTSDRLRGAAREEVGGAGLVERRFRAAAIGASSRVGKSDVDLRASLGVHGKLWLPGPRILLQAEVDAVRQTFDAGGDRWQLATYAGPTWVPARGLYVGAAYELFDQDLLIEDVERHALGGWVAYHPLAHLEVMLSGRTQVIGTSDRAHTALLQLHYYL